MLELAAITTQSASIAPSGAWVSLAIALGGGLTLWLMGVKVLKPVFALVGAAIGAFAGAVLLPLTGLDAVDLAGFTLGPTAIGAVIGGVLGALVAAGLFKFVIMISSGVVFAIAGTLIGLIVASTTGPATTPARADEPAAVEQDAEPRSVLDDVRERATDAIEDAASDAAADTARDRANGLVDGILSDEDRAAAEAQIRSAAERSRAFLGRVRDVAMDEWDRRSMRERSIILGSGVVGLVLGLFAGVVFTKRATAVFTALLGSALWIPAAVALLGVAGVNPDLLAFSPTAWAVVWGGVSVIGVALQLGVVRKAGHKKHDEDEDDED